MKPDTPSASDAPNGGRSRFDDSSPDDGLGHFCGVAGVWSPKPMAVKRQLFYMLYALQHRGQESAGIAWHEAGRHRSDRHMGMVSAASDRWLSDDAPLSCGIGHVRYSTEGGSGIQNAQPLSVECIKGHVSLAHNGNISNSSEIREDLFSRGAIFQTTSDSELFLHRISRSAETELEAVLGDALAPLEGAFSLCIMWNDKLVVIRDRHGFRPLHLGRRDGAWFAASETCALTSIGAADIREVEPGECVVIDADGERSFRYDDSSRLSHCVFELLYFARPDSYVFGESVLMSRKRFGAALSGIEDCSPDLVIPVPDSGTLAALGYSQASGIPFDYGFTRNHYAGRSFILPNKDERELAVRIKLHANPEIVSGKKVVMIDDSLVRGTTSRIIVGLLREAGAKEVHLRLSAPELKNPCYYGIDIPTREELISNRLDADGIATHVGADSVKFLPIEALKSCVKRPGDYCYACFDGQYPCPVRNGKACPGAAKCR